MTFDNISKEQVSPESFSYKSGLKLPVGQALGFDKNGSLSLRNLTSTIWIGIGKLYLQLYLIMYYRFYEND